LLLRAHLKEMIQTNFSSYPFGCFEIARQDLKLLELNIDLDCFLCRKLSNF